MVLNQFFQKKGPFLLKEIIKTVNCTNGFSKLNNLEIFDIESLSKAEKNNIFALDAS